MAKYRDKKLNDDVVTGGTGTFDGTMDDITNGATYVKTHNDFTDALESKLNGIAEGAEVNVQPDWNQATNTADDYIKNKPTIPTGIPALGATAQILQYASAGTAKWATVSGDASLADGGALAVNKTRLNVRNETGSTIASTKAVYVSGFNNLPLITLATNLTELTHNVIGVTIAPINHEADGYIATSGQFDAETNAWTVGTELYLTAAGALTSTVPTSGSVMHVAIVTVQANYPTGKLLMYRYPEENYLAGGANVDTIIRMGDSAGSNKVSFRDYANNEVASINSDGALVAVTVNGLSAAQVTDLTDSGATTLHKHSYNDLDNKPTILTLSQVYPIGAIYIETTGTNPNTTFGFGTWSAFGSGRTLVGLDAGQTEFDTSEETGGAKTHTHSVTSDVISAANTGNENAHTHTYTEVPNHVHTLATGTGASGNFSQVIGTVDTSSGGTGATPTQTALGTRSGNPVSGVATGTTSAGSSHNHTSPALTNNAVTSGNNSAISMPYIVCYFWKRTA